MRQYAAARILAPLFLVLAPVAGVLAAAELSHATAPAAVQDRADVGWNTTPVGGTPAPTPTPTA